MKFREIRGWHGELEKENLRKLQLNPILKKTAPPKKPLMIIFNIDGVIMNKQKRYEAVKKKYPNGYRFLVKEMNKPEYLLLDTPNIEFVELLNKLDELGIKICYLTNRKTEVHDLTIKQVRNAGFPGGMLKMIGKYQPDKEFKKSVVNGLLMKYDILMYVGCLYPDGAYIGQFPVKIYIIQQYVNLKTDCNNILEIIEKSI